MNTEELIKESNAEATAGIEKAANNVESLLDTIRNLRSDVAQLKDANNSLRSQILEFKNWSDDRLSQISEEIPTPIVEVTSYPQNRSAKSTY